MSRSGSVLTRLANQRSVNELLEDFGVAVDMEAGIGITAFCWANDISMASVVFEVMTEEEARKAGVEYE